MIAAAVAAGLALAACGGDDGGEDDASAAASEPAVESESSDAAESEAVSEAESEAAAGTSSEAAGGSVELATADSDLGEIIVDGEGMTLYVFDSDTGSDSTCYDACAQTWPPLTGTATAGEGADESLLGETTRDDGTTQVTYNGSPLYYYAPDSAPGDTQGQAVGDVWWVVGPDGEKIEG